MIYPIVRYGNPVLERPTEPVTDFDTPQLHQFIEEMFQSMYAAKGVGLAATQIGFARRIAVIDCSVGEDPAQRIVLINPQIIRSEGKQKGEESKHEDAPHSNRIADGKEQNPISGGSIRFWRGRSIRAASV